MNKQALMGIAKSPALSFARRGEYRAALEVGGAS